jgi:hypothetical protein
MKAHVGRVRGGVSHQHADHGMATFLTVQGSATQIGVQVCAQTQDSNEVADIFLAASFALRRTACTDFDALSQNLALKVLRKFSARIGKRLSLVTMLTVRRWPL